MTADEEDEGSEEKRHRWRVRELAISCKNVFWVTFPSWNTFRYPPHPLLEKEIDFCLEFVRSGNQKQDNGTPHGERLRGAISNQSARGLTNPSIVPPQPPAAHQHIRPHPNCPPPSCSGICSPQQPVLSKAVRAEVSHWQFVPNRFVRASNCSAPTWVSGFGFCLFSFFFLWEPTRQRPWSVCTCVSNHGCVKSEVEEMVGWYMVSGVMYPRGCCWCWLGWQKNWRLFPWKYPANTVY